MGRLSPKSQPGAEMSMALTCQTCGADVDMAYYQADHGILTWECPGGHKSQLKDFFIG